MSRLRRESRDARKNRYSASAIVLSTKTITICTVSIIFFAQSGFSALKNAFGTRRAIHSMRSNWIFLRCLSGTMNRAARILLIGRCDSGNQILILPFICRNRDAPSQRRMARSRTCETGAAHGADGTRKNF